MKILQLISGQAVNGALVHVDLLTRELLKRGHEVQLLCKPRSWIWRRLHPTGIAKRRSTFSRFPPGELLRIAKWIKQEKFDVIHTHMSSAHFFGVLLRSLTGVPCVATAHTSHFQLHWWFNDLVIANSESTRDFQEKKNRVSPDRLVTIPCFVDLKKFRQTSSETRNLVRSELRLKPGQPTIGVVGAVTGRKGQLELVDAIPELLREFPDLKFVFIGQFEKETAYYKKIRQSLFEKKLFRRVIWVGRRNNVHELIQALDVCVVPSLKEPLGLCALEAMAAGVPVAAARVGGLQEFVKEGRTGLLFDPKNPQQMAEKITRLIRDEPLRRTVTENSYQLLDNHFSPQVITERIESAYIQAMEMKHSVKRRAA